MWRTNFSWRKLDGYVYRLLFLKGQFIIVTGNVNKTREFAVQISARHFARNDNS